MSDSAEAWHAEHANFARLLDFLEQQVNLFAAGAEPAFDLMLDAVTYMRSFPERIHHRREDAIFARLVARDPALLLSVNRLLQEHRVIQAAGEELHDMLKEAAEGGIAPRVRLEAAAATYLVYYRHHLTSEETSLVPRSLKLLTPDDWAEVDRAVGEETDPLFGAVVSDVFRALRARMDAATSGA